MMPTDKGWTDDDGRTDGRTDGRRTTDGRRRTDGRGTDGRTTDDGRTDGVDRWMEGQTDLFLPLPKDHKAEVCIWADLPVIQTETILTAAGNRGKIHRLLAEIFQLEDCNVNSRSAVLLDLYYFTIQYAIDKGFNKEQTSTFFSIVKKTHEVCIETPFGNLDQCFNYFKELVLCHAVKRPPWSIHLFSPEQVGMITEYVVNTYFRHYKLYKYAFTPVVKLDLSINYVGLPDSSEQEEENQSTADPEQTEASGDKNEAVAVRVGDDQTTDEPQGQLAFWFCLKTILCSYGLHQQRRITEIPRTEKIITAQLNEEISKLGYPWTSRSNSRMILFSKYSAQSKVNSPVKPTEDRPSLRKDDVPNDSRRPTNIESKMSLFIKLSL
ncbi:putative coiled-coil domain-containing protein [Apostichopus japonicus]|uniref:Putative coiled-coil domain-containing protein n=1 Tax=Stichopus japonicus TaxID=307972 RepID=A0A2G8KUF3_STIJA|nr:putative coiled-coil domain-containing protein [Apostichopus japonicus]